MTKKKKKNIIKNFFANKKSRRIFLVFVFVAIAAVIFWNRRRNQQVEFSEYELSRQDISQTLVLSGTLDAKERVYLNFLAGGRLVYLGAKEGDWVKKWQTIASIDYQDLQKNLEKNLNFYENRRLDWDAQLKDDEGEILDDDEKRARQQNQNLLDNTVLDVEIISVAVNNRVMSAPFAGILLSVPTPVTGVVLSPSDVFELVNPQTLLVRAEVDEIDLNLLSVGQKAKLIFDAYPEENIETNVSFIALKSTMGATGTVFKLELPVNGVEDLGKYRLGMNVDVEIELDKKANVLVIPLQAISSQQGQTIVKVKSQNRQGFEERAIELGLESDEMAEVVGGLEEGEIILIES
jgi:multidrug efflux pump subunit AcrA (membrane-fusion protein)